MSKEHRNEVDGAIVEAKDTEVVEKVEPEKKSVKVKRFIVKHGKKIAAGSALLAAVMIGYFLGHKSGGDEGCDDVGSTDDAVGETIETE